MNRGFICLVVSWFIIAGGNCAYCHGPQDFSSQYGYSFPWGADPVVSQALGRGYVHGPGWDLSSPGWFSMNHEDWEKLKKVRDDFQKDTLELRKQLLVKQTELITLWAQPVFEPASVEKLSSEVAQLQAELSKKRGQHLIKCRQQFGGENWSCPGIWLGTTDTE